MSPPDDETGTLIDIGFGTGKRRRSSRSPAEPGLCAAGRTNQGQKFHRRSQTWRRPAPLSWIVAPASAVTAQASGCGANERPVARSGVGRRLASARHCGNSGPQRGVGSSGDRPRTACVMSLRLIPMSLSNRSSKASSSRSACRVRRQCRSLAKMPRKIRLKKALRVGAD